METLSILHVCVECVSFCFMLVRVCGPDVSAVLVTCLSVFMFWSLGYKARMFTMFTTAVVSHHTECFWCTCVCYYIIIVQLLSIRLSSATRVESTQALFLQHLGEITH